MLVSTALGDLFSSRCRPKKGTMFRVQPVIDPADLSRSWTVTDDSGLPVAAVEEFLAFLSAKGSSPLTVRTYAHGLALFLRFTDEAGLSWETIGLSDVAEFVFWLRRPAANVIVIHPDASGRAASTVNKILAAVSSFYDFQARSGSVVAERLHAWRQIANRSYKPFLHHVTKSKPMRTSVLRVRTVSRLPATLTADHVGALVESCDRLRDRFLLMLLYETGMRIGQALGLRHEDVRTWERIVRIVPRDDNANGARAKTRVEHEIPVSSRLTTLYSDYMHAEYGELDSDYVFVNLWGGAHGHALSYSAVDGLVRRLRARTGIEFHVHQLRHTHATEMLRCGVRLEVVSKRLGHSSIQTTQQTYAHLDAEDLRQEMAPYWAQHR
jgi:integrase/recombinase XerD